MLSLNMYTSRTPRQESTLFGSLCASLQRFWASRTGLQGAGLDLRLTDLPHLSVHERALWVLEQLEGEKVGPLAQGLRIAMEKFRWSLETPDLRDRDLNLREAKRMLRNRPELSRVLEGDASEREALREVDPVRYHLELAVFALNSCVYWASQGSKMQRALVVEDSRQMLSHIGDAGVALGIVYFDRPLDEE